MSLFQALRPASTALRSSFAACQCGAAAAATTVRSPFLTFARNATSLSQGRANGARDGPGKRLGAKKGSEEYVIPGNIIFRQRGTKWFPGDNCAMGRDHTIYATQPGYVRFYRDPLKHPSRRYIGVVFERGQTLPNPPNAARRRRLGMLAIKVDEAANDLRIQQDKSRAAVNNVVKKAYGREFTLREGYSYREPNWQIGRAAEKAGISVDPFRPGDRWMAWRKSTARKARVAEKRGMSKK